MEKTKRARIAEANAPRRRSQPPMTVLIRDKPPTYDWGWFSREDQRMHLQAVDKNHWDLHYKVWLEKKGKKVFEPEPGIPAKVLKVFQSEATRRRGMIETYWIIFMIENDWLRAKLVGDTIFLYAYPDTPNHFERTIQLSEIIPNKEVAAMVTPQDVVLNKEFGMLELFPKRNEAARPHVRLEDILWVG